MPQKYTTLQVLLHWLIAALVLSQYMTSFAIIRTHEPRLIGQKPDPTDMLLHTAHNRVGLLILALMIVRLVLRLSRPARKATPVGYLPADLAARFVHWGFYAVLIAQAVTGAVASYLWWPASTVHVFLFKILVLLLIGHVLAAAWHQLVLRDGTLFAMFPRRNKAEGR